jgi:hypothetical protein
MIRTIVLASLAVASTAGAEPLDFGARGQFALSADRLSPLFSYSRISTDTGGGDSTTNTTTSMSLLWTGAPEDVYDVPRVGLDYVVAPSITVGGELFGTIPFSASRSTTMGGMTTSRDTAKYSAFGIGARGGYVLALSHGLAFWPRGGLSYARESTSNAINMMGGGSQSTTVSQFALNLEPIFMIQAAPHVGVVFGPVLDIPLSGNTHNEVTIGTMTVSTDNSTSQFHFGITLGLLGWL